MNPKSKSKPWSILIYGQPKIGLSTLASQLPDPLWLNLDDDLSYLEPKKVIDITSWQDFIQAGSDICAGKYQAATVVLSHLERLWTYACDHVTSLANGKNGTSAENISELSFSDWRQAIDLFETKLRKLTSLGNTILLSHEITEVRNIRGIERMHFMANMERKVNLVVQNLVDATGRLYTVEQDIRILSFVSQENQVTGSRIPELQGQKFVFQDQNISSFTKVIESIKGTNDAARGKGNDSHKPNQKSSEIHYTKRSPAHHH